MNSNGTRMIWAAVKAVALEYEITAEDVRTGKSRLHIEARYMAMYVAKEKGEFASRLGEWFGITPQGAGVGINRMAERLRLYEYLRERYARVIALFPDCFQSIISQQ